MIIDVSEDFSAPTFSAQEVQVNSDPEHGGSNLL
jgi:hypothetical protein